MKQQLFMYTFALTLVVAVFSESVDRGMEKSLLAAYQHMLNDPAQELIDHDAKTLTASFGQEAYARMRLESVVPHRTTNTMPKQACSDSFEAPRFTCSYFLPTN